MRHVNAWLDRAAAIVTRIVGTMWTAVIFAVITCFSLPAVIESGSIIIWVQWLGSVFLQLVLLPIIMVGQNLQSAKTESIIRETHDQVSEALHDIRQLVAETHAHVTKEQP